MAVDWILMVIFAYVIFSFCSIIDKIIISKQHIQSPFVFVVFNGMSSLIVFGMLFFHKVTVPSFTQMLIALGSGATYIGLLLPYYKALEHEDISTIAPLFQLTPIFVLLLSFLTLGEILSLNQYIGFFLLLTGGFLISVKKTKGIFSLSKAFYLIMLSNIIGAASTILTKAVYKNQEYLDGFFWVRMGTILAVIFVLLFNSYRIQFIQTVKKMNSKVKLLLGGKVVIDFIGIMCINYAFIDGPASLISALGESIYPVLVFILVIILALKFPDILKEDIGRRTLFIKFFSILIIISGIWFIYW